MSIENKAIEWRTIPKSAVVHACEELGVPVNKFLLLCLADIATQNLCDQGFAVTVLHDHAKGKVDVSGTKAGSEPASIILTLNEDTYEQIGEVAL